MNKLLIAAAAVFLASAGAADAATITGYYTVTDSMTTGNNAPVIADDLGTYTSGHQYISTTLNALTVNTPSTAANLFTATPTGSSCGYNCASNTATGIITVTFHVTDALNHSGTATFTGDYDAKYSGTYLGCSGKSGSGQSDCIDWTSTDPVYINFGDGTVLEITLGNAEDWSITPKVSFDLDPVTATPLPAALPLFVGGLGLMSLLGLRRKRKPTRSAL
jgi:hypothetical protein